MIDTIPPHYTKKKKIYAYAILYYCTYWIINLQLASEKRRIANRHNEARFLTLLVPFLFFLLANYPY